MEWLRQGCDGINRVQPDVKCDFVCLDQTGFKKYQPADFRELTNIFMGHHVQLSEKNST
jgi:hypothetical protein